MTITDIAILLTPSGNLPKEVESAQMVKASKLVAIMCECVYLRLVPV